MDDEYRLLLQAIVDSYDEDTPRLVLADWLQEHGDEDRARFIRVQIALHNGSTESVHAFEEAVLLGENERKWLPKCGTCFGERKINTHFDPSSGEQRGGVKCLHCNGCGYAGKLVRGFVDSMFAGNLQACFQATLELWIPSDWLCRLMHDFPTIREVNPLYCPPWEYTGTDLQQEWGWWDIDNGEDGYAPAPLFDLMWAEWVASRHEDANGRWLLWRHREDAISALGEAIAQFGRTK